MHMRVVARIVGLLALLVCAPAQSVPPAGINPVLGDASWIARFGAPPPLDATEIQRIRVHLAYVEERLRAQPPVALDGARLAMRSRLLDALARYRIAAEFPHNDQRPGRRPRLIDDDGRLCAVGYLIAISAGREVIEDLRRDYEWAELSSIVDPRLAAWAEAHGFTLDELAMIQPVYDRVPRSLRAPPPRPSRAALIHYFARLQDDVERCADQHKAPKGTVVTLKVFWPAATPLLLEAAAPGDQAQLERCVLELAKQWWRRRYGSIEHADSTERNVVMRYRAR